MCLGSADRLPARWRVRGQDIPTVPALSGMDSLPVMATLDYAFLADYAKVDANGTLTAVGASWTNLQTPSLPTQHRMSIAGRVRAKLAEGPVDLRIQIQGPEDVFHLGMDAQLEAGPDARPYGDGNIGHLFAVDMQVPLPKAGLYTVTLSVDGKPVRDLKFDVEQAPAQS